MNILENILGPPKSRDGKVSFTFEQSKIGDLELKLYFQ